MARILIIDDEDLVRLTVGQTLKKMGHEIEEADNGEIGEQMFREGTYDLVFYDIIMPRKEGIQTIIEMRKANRSIPIIAMSGGGRTRNTDFLEMAETLGATATLPKPFGRAELTKLVLEFLPQEAA